MPIQKKIPKITPSILLVLERVLFTNLSQLDHLHQCMQNIFNQFRKVKTPKDTKRKPTNCPKHVEIITQSPLKCATQTKHVSRINCLSHCLRSVMALAALLPCFQARGWSKLKATEWVAEGWSRFQPCPSRSLTRCLIEIIVSISSNSDRLVMFLSSPPCKMLKTPDVR